MGILNIIIQATGFLFGTKNVKSKAIAVWAGLPISMVVYPVLETIGYIPEGFSSKIEDFNLPWYFNYIIGLSFLLWSFKEDIKKFLASFLTSNGRRDANIEKCKDELELLELSVKIAKTKKELKIAEKEYKDIDSL